MLAKLRVHNAGPYNQPLKNNKLRASLICTGKLAGKPVSAQVGKKWFFNWCAGNLPVNNISKFGLINKHVQQT